MKEFFGEIEILDLTTTSREIEEMKGHIKCIVEINEFNELSLSEDYKEKLPLVN